MGPRVFSRPHLSPASVVAWPIAGPRGSDRRRPTAAAGDRGVASTCRRAPGAVRLEENDSSSETFWRRRGSRGYTRIDIRLGQNAGGHDSNERDAAAMSKESPRLGRLTPHLVGARVAGALGVRRYPRSRSRVQQRRRRRWRPNAPTNSSAEKATPTPRPASRTPRASRTVARTRWSARSTSRGTTQGP